MIDKDDCTFSDVYSLLKIKRKANIFENIFLGIGIFLWFYFYSFELLKWQKKSYWQKSADVIQ